MTRDGKRSEKRVVFTALTAALLAAMAVLLAAPNAAVADNGKASTTMSFFSGGNGAHADWLATSDQPPGDTDNQAIRLITTNGAPTYEKGYAGILFHHVTGIPAEVFPDSAFWNKTPCPYFGNPATLGTPRLVVLFQNAAGEPDGYGDLRENVRGCDWEKVSDAEFPGGNTTPGAYPNSAWDVMGGPCGFRYNVVWSVVQGCFAGHTTLAVYITTDAYGIYHLIDDITVNGKTFSSASDNGNGNNSPAGPAATTDLSLLPPLPIPMPQTR
jgi:hypothetical protein